MINYIAIFVGKMDLQIHYCLAFNDLIISLLYLYIAKVHWCFSIATLG